MAGISKGLLVILVLTGLVFGMVHTGNDSRCVDSASPCLEPCILNCRAVLPSAALEIPQTMQLFHAEILGLYHSPFLEVVTPPPRSSQILLG